MKKNKIDTVIIDARPSFDGVPTALLRVGGETIIQRHLRLAKKIWRGNVYVLETGKTVSAHLDASDDVIFSETITAQKNGFILSTLNIYKENSPQLVWTLRNAADVSNAQGELERSEFFTISKHTLRPLGKKFSGWLYRHTPLQANHLTIARIVLGLAAAWLFFTATPWRLCFAGIFVLTSWFLDLTDGQLARLRNHTSKFGAYLDSVGDGVVDNLYYLAISWNLYSQSGNTQFLAWGMFFLFGKYVFVNSTLLIPVVLPKETTSTGPPIKIRDTSSKKLIKTVISILDDTDVRIHFLALAAVLQVPFVPLIFHVIYFNLRWVLNLGNAYLKYEFKKGNR